MRRLASGIVLQSMRVVLGFSPFAVLRAVRILNAVGQPCSQALLCPVFSGKPSRQGQLVPLYLYIECVVVALYCHCIVLLHCCCIVSLLHCAVLNLKVFVQVLEHSQFPSVDSSVLCRASCAVFCCFIVLSYLFSKS